MAVPKRRMSKARKRKRRAHDSIKAIAQIRCSNCGSAVIPHRVCSNCGHYRGRDVLNLGMES